MVIYFAIKMEGSVVLRLRYFSLFTLNARPESVADRLSLNRVNSVTCTAFTFRVQVHGRVRQEVRPKLVRRRYREDFNETPPG